MRRAVHGLKDSVQAHAFVAIPVRAVQLAKQRATVNQIVGGIGRDRADEGVSVKRGCKIGIAHGAYSSVVALWEVGGWVWITQSSAMNRLDAGIQELGFSPR